MQALSRSLFFSFFSLALFCLILFLILGDGLILFLQHLDPIGSGSVLVILEVAGPDCIVPGQICTCQITWSQSTFSSMPSFVGFNPCLSCLRLLEFSNLGVLLRFAYLNSVCLHLVTCPYELLLLLHCFNAFELPVNELCIVATTSERLFYSKMCENVSLTFRKL